jgi:hypothetical protein
MIDSLKKLAICFNKHINKLELKIFNSLINSRLIIKQFYKFLSYYLINFRLII